MKALIDLGIVYCLGFGACVVLTGLFSGLQILLVGLVHVAIGTGLIFARRTSQK
ncbi:hypothetical protein [Stratiformator vulcanicus]|uniref:hypothetical protein n=1 Tax=Stratiformator vulcanicus TaxID=2527980 RepID=UPI0028775D2F|nr:hypothetical protein [Stratiformator vulcanicus]